MSTATTPKELRDDILDLVLKIYQEAAAANEWDEPPKAVEEIMDEIFRLVSLGLGVTD